MPKSEHWSVDAADGDVAQLDIPADLERERVFEIYCRFAVRHKGRAEASHALRVLVNSALEWSRRVQTHPGADDSLDYRFRRTVPSGQPLRLTAIGETHLASRISLGITADEE